jgi:hypothetical protein
MNIERKWNTGGDRSLRQRSGDRKIISSVQGEHVMLYLALDRRDSHRRLCHGSEVVVAPDHERPMQAPHCVFAVIAVTRVKWARTCRRYQPLAAR